MKIHLLIIVFWVAAAQGDKNIHSYGIINNKESTLGLYVTLKTQNTKLWKRVKNEVIQLLKVTEIR